MKSTAAALILFLQVQAEALILPAAQDGACGKHTKVCLAQSINAMEEPQFECKPAVHGEKVVMEASESQYGAKICGPGSFDFSPMQCAGDNFEYKKASHDVSAASTTTGCTVVPLKYTMACYSVAC